MPRVTNVKKAQKPQGSCGDCGKKIDKGDPYKWLKKRYGPKRIRCPGCAFRPSDHTGGRLGEVYDAQEDAAKAASSWDSDDVSELQEVLNDFGQRLEELADEYQESCDNIREHFSESEKADECEEKSEQLNEWKDALENVDLDEWSPSVEDTIECEMCGKETAEQQREVDGEVEYVCSDDECGCEFTVEVKNDEDQTIDEWRDAQREKADEAINDCPM